MPEAEIVQDFALVHDFATTANGTLTLIGDGSFSYNPDPGFSGANSFSYAASDGVLDSNIATVAITVGPGEG